MIHLTKPFFVTARGILVIHLGQFELESFEDFKFKGFFSGSLLLMLSSIHVD